MIKRVTASAILMILIVTGGIGHGAQEEAEQEPVVTNGFIPPVTYSSLLNGLEILIVERPQAAEVTVGLMIKRGSAFDLVGKEGTADLTASMVLRGSQPVNDQSLDEQFQALDVTAEASVNWDATKFRFQAPPQNLAPLFPILATIFVRDTFPEDDLAALKKQRIEELRQSQSSPSDLAAREFSRRVFARHTYARPVQGTIESLGVIRAKDILLHYRRFYLANNAVLTVVGNVSAETLLPLIRPTFGALRRGKIVPATFRAPQEPTGIQIKVIDRPGAREAALWLGRQATSRGSEDFEPLRLLQYALSGTSSSRLGQLGSGLAPEPVSFSSQFDARVLLGSFAISATCRSGFAPSLVSRLLQFIETIRAEGVPPADVIAAKQHFIDSFPDRLQTSRGIVDQLQDIELYDLGRDFIVSFVHRLERVTPERIRAVAANYLSATDLYIVVVGPAEEMLSHLKTIGTVEVMK